LCFFTQGDPQAYADALKTDLADVFKSLTGANYSDAKKLRKITKALNKHAKYMQNPALEADLWIWFAIPIAILWRQNLRHKLSEISL
jgi:hypothetical protein